MPRTLSRRRDSAPDAEAYVPAEDEEEEDQPRPARGRSRRTDEEDDEPRARRKAAAPPSTAGKGWKDFNKEKSASGDYAENLKVSDEAILIKFLEEEPFAVYKQHWLERQGKKSFTCHGDGCIICDDLGDKPRLQVSFNVVDLSDPDNAEVKVWTVGTRVAGQLKNFAADKKTAPLDRENLYWSVSKTGTGTKTQYTITPVKERDLADDWDIDPLEAGGIDELRKQCYTDSIVDMQTKKELQDVVDELMDEE